ncbi:hypothetical protein ACJZ2D_008601 [Fusarium nematophilum]
MAGETPQAVQTPSPQRSPKSDHSSKSSPGRVPLSTPDAPPIEVGEDDPAGDAGDADSALGSDTSSSSASITSSILDYRSMHGRRYHSERGNAEYWAPNDEQQNEVMDIQHHLLTLVPGGKLYLAPVQKDIEKALDIGTGTGILAIDFADEFPSTEVIGTDLSPIQPSWVPTNLKFLPTLSEIEDCTQEWTFREDSFDYIHMRYLVGSVQDWFALYRQAYKVCKPGGWIESYEGIPRMDSDDGTVSEDTAMYAWGKTFIEAGKNINRSFTVVDENLQEEGMRAAGLVDIESRTFKSTLEGDIEGHVLHVANLTWGWSKEEVAVYCAKLRREVRSGKYHPYYKVRIVYGRKPE